MLVNIHRFFLFTIGSLFFILSCGPDSSNILRPTDIFDIMQPSLVAEATEMPTTDAQVSFERDLLPILRARCAFAGCHDARGPDGLNFSTYESFIRGGEDGPVFTPGNARSSDIVEEIVSGRMPPGGPRLTDTQIQAFIDWINQQESTIISGIRRNYDDDDDDDDYKNPLSLDDDDYDETTMMTMTTMTPTH